MPRAQEFHRKNFQKPLWSSHHALWNPLRHSNGRAILCAVYVSKESASRWQRCSCENPNGSTRTLAYSSLISWRWIDENRTRWFASLSREIEKRHPGFCVSEVSRV